MNSKLDKIFKWILSIFILLIYYHMLGGWILADLTFDNFFMLSGYRGELRDIITKNINKIFRLSDVFFYVLNAYLIILIAYKIIKKTTKIKMTNSVRNIISILPILLVDITIAFGYFQSQIVLEHLKK